MHLPGNVACCCKRAASTPPSLPFDALGYANVYKKRPNLPCLELNDLLRLYMYGDTNMPPMPLPVLLQYTMLDLTSYFDDTSGIHVASAALCTFLVTYLLSLFARRNSHPLPPGPRPMPLIGNLLDMPKGLEGPHWAMHKNLYGTSV